MRVYVATRGIIMEIKRVSLREFQQYTAKYLKEVPLIVTKRGKDWLRVATIDRVATYEIATEEEVATKVESDWSRACASKISDRDVAKVGEPDMQERKKAMRIEFGVHSCGCAKEEGKILCKKHGRV